MTHRNPIALVLVLVLASLIALAPSGTGGSEAAFAPALHSPPAEPTPAKKGQAADDIPDAEAYQRLMANERAATDTGASPQALGAAVQGTHRILVLPVEFTGSQTFNYEMPDPAGGCVTQAVTINGPLHNAMPAPTPPDNGTLWIPDFSADYYRKLIFDTGPDGGAGVVRTDLNGGAGVDLSGLTFANYYLEQSEGALHAEGAVEDWLQVPVSVGEYGADACGDTTLHDSQNGPSSRLVKDTVDALNTRDPAFDWYQYDTDKDGYLDHLMVIHAGPGQDAANRTPEDMFNIWSHRGELEPANGLGPGGKGGYQAAPPTAENPLGVWVLGHTVMAENGGLGAFVHEYGHDLGLPDIYSYDNENSTGYWDLMSAGSWSGEIPGTTPSGLGIWERWVLGWADPAAVDLGDAPFEAVVGQAAITPQNTEEGIRVNLPDEAATFTSPPQGQKMWWGGQGNKLDNSLGRTSLSLAGKSPPITLAFKTWLDIEKDWDYGYVQVSTDAGQTWVSLDDTGDLTTAEDPNQANRGNGITGSRGWTDASFDLSAYAGETVALRFRYDTDAAVAGKGWFIDDIKISDAGGVFFSDGAEAGAGGWTASPPDGWTIEDGVIHYPRYYLVEWRNDSGFDHGLRHGYNKLPSQTGSQIENLPAAVPGMLVWYRNHVYEGNLYIDPNFDNPPSIGPKGFLLLVDAHPWPLRWPGGDNLFGRRQPADAAFTLQDTPQFSLTDPDTSEPVTFGPRPARDGFHDVLGYYPGYNYPGSGSTVYFNDRAASLVVPAPEDYSIRITNPDGSPYLAGWGNTIGAYHQGSGDPGTHAYGVNIVIAGQAAGGSWGRIRVYTDKDTFLGRVKADKQSAGLGDVITYTIGLKDAAGSVLATGEPLSYAATLSDPIPAGTAYVQGSLTGAGASYDAGADRINWAGSLGGTGVEGPDVTITFQVQVQQSTGEVLNTATVNIGAGNYQPDENTYVLSAVTGLSLHGDADCNGAVDTVDALKILRHVAGLNVSQGQGCPGIGSGDPVFGDIDCNGHVDSVDSLRILRHVAGLPNNLPDGCGPIGG